MITIINSVAMFVVIILVVIDLVNASENKDSKEFVRAIFELIILAVLVVFNMVEAM